MKDFTRIDALRNLRNWSDPANLPSDEDVNAELTRLRALSKAEKKQVMVTLGTPEEILDVDDRLEALEANTACYTIDYTITNARIATTSNFLFSIIERYNDLGITLNNNTGKLSGFANDGVYKLEYSVSNSYSGNITSTGIKLTYGVIASTNVSYGRGVTVDCSHLSTDIANDARKNFNQALYIAKRNEHLDVTYYLDPGNVTNVIKISNLLLITRIK